MRDSLLALPKAHILDLIKHVNGGTVGFDHERVKKSECVDRLLSFGESTVQAAMADLPAPAIPATTPAPAQPSVDQTQIAAQIGALFASLAGSAVNEDKVRSIVQAEVTSALERSPVVRIEVVRPDGTVIVPEGHVRPEFKDIVLDATCGLNILLVGPAGSGKTHLAHQVAEALGRGFASVSCTAGMSESVLSGWLLPVDGGAFDYVESDFVRLYENGGVFLFDEVDAADPNTLLFINQALANGSFFLPQRKGRTLVKRHADFVCIAAANTFGNGANGTYAGRERLDEAFLDRFRAGRHFVDYDTTFERVAVAPELLAWGWAVRKRITELRMQRVMSTRFLLDATKLLKAGATFDRVKNKFFLDWKSEDRQKVDV
jgi:cobaltochelatase CobS